MHTKKCEKVTYTACFSFSHNSFSTVESVRFLCRLSLSGQAIYLKVLKQEITKKKEIEKFLLIKSVFSLFPNRKFKLSEKRYFYEEVSRKFQGVQENSSR